MIEKEYGACNYMMEGLLEAFQIDNLGMTWEQFLEQFKVEMLETIETWKKEKVE